MAVLYDRQGVAHEIPDEQVAQALLSGQYAYPKGQDIIMRSASGELYDVPPEGAAEMYRRGYRIETGAEREQRELKEQYGGTFGKLVTGLHGATKSATFGLIDQIGAAVGGEKYTEGVKALKQVNPDEELAGELAGVFLPLIPGSQAKAVGGLKSLRLGSGVRSVAKLGRKVEDATLKMLGGAKGGLVRKALAKAGAMGTGAGVEGTIYGAGEFISEQALGETEATAENLLSHMGMGAMWGGFAGAGFGAGGEVLKRGLGAGVNFAKRSSKSIVRMFEKSEGVKAAEGLEQAIESQIWNPKVGKYSKAMGAALGEDAENIARLTQGGKAGRRAREIASQSAKDRDNSIRILSELQDQVDNVYEKATDQMMGRMKIKNMGSIQTVKNEAAATQDAFNVIEGSLNEIDDMLKQEVGGFPVYSGASGGRLKQAQRSIMRHQRDLKSALEKRGPDAMGEVHGIIDSMKRDLQKIRKGMRVPGQKLEVMEAAKAIEDIQEKFRLHLERPDFYGEVGAAQQRFNSTWSRILGKNKLGRKLREVIGEKEFRNIYATNRGAMEHFVNNFGRARNDVMEDYFINQLNDKIEFVRLVKDTFEELPDDLVSKLEYGESLVKKLRSEYDRTYKQVALQNQLGDIVSKSSMMQGLLPMGAGAGLGYLLGGEEGLALGLGLSVFTNPGRMIQMRAALERLSGNVSLDITKSLKSYISKATGKVVKKGKGLIAPTSLKILQDSNWGEKRTKDKNRHEAFERRTKELTEFLTNPQKTMDRISENVKSVTEAAPQVAQSMQVKAVKAARYLYDRAPKPLNRGTLLTGKWKPSDLELAKFERIAAVIENPKNALESLKAGNLTVEEVDALRENYPRIYEQIVTTLVEQIPELQDKLPYKERVQLSILFDVPVDPTMEPEFLATMYTLGQVPQPMPGQLPGPKQPKSKIGKYTDLNIDKASLSSSQRIEFNKLA